MADRDRLRQHVQGQLWKDPLIGEGKLGKVYKVSGLNKEQLILKISGFEDATKKEDEYFTQEVDTLKRFQHLHIIKYIDGWESRDEGRQLSVYLLTEYATGGDLKTYLYQQLKKPPPEATFGSWLTQIASGLDFIHSMGVIHRNLKTSNVLVDIHDSHLVLKIGDFGMSKVLNSPDAMTKSFVGTPFFMSPELFNNIPYNSKTDIWSFGCTAFEIATLTTLFKAKTFTTLISGVNKVEAAKLMEQIKYGDFFKTLVQEMLNRDYRRRPDSGAVLQVLLDKGYTSNCSVDTASSSAAFSQSHRKGRTANSTSTSSSSSKGHRTSKKKAEGRGSSERQSSKISSTCSTSSAEGDSMAVYNVSNPHWADIDKRTAKEERAEVAVIPIVLGGSRGRLRTRSEGGPPPETEAALAQFSALQRRKSKEEREGKRLSKSGPVKSVSFYSPRTDTSGYNSGAEAFGSSQTDLTEESEDEAYVEPIAEEQPAGDEERVLCQITRLQSNLSQTLGEGVFEVAFNTLNIRDEKKMQKELESVLGDKYNDFGVQFATLRLLEGKYSDYEKPSRKKGGALSQTI